MIIANDPLKDRDDPVIFLPAAGSRPPDGLRKGRPQLSQTADQPATTFSLSQVGLVRRRAHVGNAQGPASTMRWRPLFTHSITYVCPELPARQRSNPRQFGTGPLRVTSQAVCSGWCGRCSPDPTSSSPRSGASRPRGGMRHARGPLHRR